MEAEKKRYNVRYDLTNCDAEPLRFIRSCQAHAFVLICYLEDLRIKAFSENFRERYPARGGLVPGTKLTDLLPAETFARVRAVVDSADYATANPIIHQQKDAAGNIRKENLVIHRSGDLLILEFEEREESVNHVGFLQKIDHALQKIQGSVSSLEMLEATVGEVKVLTGYDRVWLYEFDEEYNGTIVAEAVEQDMPSYLHLRYPHTDIPEQARKLFLKQQIRQIVTSCEDSDALLISDDDQPIDLGAAVNRAVSPIHLEYLRNMGVGATMSIAIVVDGKLWGLLACHHRSPKLIDYRLRKVLGFFGRIISGHLSLRYSIGNNVELMKTRLIRSRLMEQMNENLSIEDLLLREDDLLQLVGASGAVLVMNGEYSPVGECPQTEELDQLVAFLRQQDGTVFHTNRLFEEFPASKGFTTAPAGIMVANLSTMAAEYLIWFRPEIVETVTWGGRPSARKVIENGRVRLHPELSFASWEESVAGQAEDWASHHVNAVAELRDDIKEIIMQRFQEISSLNERLVAAYKDLEGFSYTVSHDLRAPLRSIRGYAEILQDDYSKNLDDEGKGFLKTIVENVGKMNQFINDILDFSRLGRVGLMVGNISLEAMVNDIWQDISMSRKTSVRLIFDDLQTATVPADHTMLFQILLNLLGNAEKYSRKIDDAWVKVRSRTEQGYVVVEIEDNGIGFEMKFADRVFEVFNRLVTDDEYEGTGVGLAVVKRIVEKHKGTITVNSVLGAGTIFSFKIPVNLAELLVTETDL